MEEKKRPLYYSVPMTGFAQPEESKTAEIAQSSAPGSSHVTFAGQFRCENTRIV